MSASVGSRRAGSKAWGGWAAVAVVVLLSVSLANAQGGTFTDKRDGQTYRTVVIGEQTWMAKNLNYKMGKSVCYDNKESNCTKYGRLYNWDDAMKACPAGWHLPSGAEWETLVNSAGGKETAGTKLKSKNGWKNLDDGSSGNGTDEFGFSALPGGERDPYGEYGGAGTGGLWWSATEDKDYAWYRLIYNNFEHTVRWGTRTTYLFSVRCVRDV